jgi:hypothetical protein
MAKLAEQLSRKQYEFKLIYNPATAIHNPDLLKLSEEIAEISEILEENHECEACDGWGGSECSECGHDRACHACGATGLIPKS